MVPHRCPTRNPCFGACMCKHISEHTWTIGACHGNRNLLADIPFQFRHIGKNRSRVAAPLCCSPRRSRYGHRAAEHAQASLAHQRRPALVAQQRGAEAAASGAVGRAHLHPPTRGGAGHAAQRRRHPPQLHHRHVGRPGARGAAGKQHELHALHTLHTIHSPHASHSTRFTTLCTLCAHSRCLLHAEPPSLPRLLAAEARRPRRLAPAAGSRPRAPERSRAGEGAVRDEAGARAARRAHRRTLSPRRTQSPKPERSPESEVLTGRVAWSLGLELARPRPRPHPSPLTPHPHQSLDEQTSQRSSAQAEVRQVVARRPVHISRPARPSLQPSSARPSAQLGPARPGPARRQPAAAQPCGSTPRSVPRCASVCLGVPRCASVCLGPLPRMGDWAMASACREICREISAAASDLPPPLLAASRPARSARSSSRPWRRSATSRRAALPACTRLGTSPWHPATVPRLTTGL
eukprot:scaffold32309_cov62-Phaeocystis_antarctica.AAC.4